MDKSSHYADSYFSGARASCQRHGHLRHVPPGLVDWYFETLQPGMERLYSNYAYFHPRPTESRALEIGFGEGKFMRYCGPKNVVGVDVWEPGVRALKAEGFEAHVADATQRLPFPDASFDVVYTSQVIEHVWDGVHFVGEMARVLKPGGRAVIRTMDFERCYKGFYADYTHIKPYTKISLHKLLSDLGFEVREVRNGFFPSSFWLRRLSNLVVMLPPSLQRLWLFKVCPLSSHEVYAIAVKKAPANEKRAQGASEGNGP